jgi:hypothetical protein
MSRVVVHIDRLVLPHGADAHAVEAAVREAVTRELAHPGATERVVSGGDRSSVDAGSVRAGAGSAAIGAAISRGITGGSE